jgi:hypothetical protein
VAHQRLAGIVQQPLQAFEVVVGHQQVVLQVGGRQAVKGMGGGLAGRCGCEHQGSRAAVGFSVRPRVDGQLRSALRSIFGSTPAEH